MTDDPTTGLDRLRFSYRNETHTLRRGARFDSTVHDTYRDTPAAEMLGIIAGITAGAPWRQVVASRYATSNPWLHRIVTDPQRDLFFRLFPPASGCQGWCSS